MYLSIHISIHKLACAYVLHNSIYTIYEIHIYVCIYICMHTYIYAYIYIYMHTSVFNTGDKDKRYTALYIYI